MKKFISEFKDFIMRGNVIDLAVGVVIGAAFQSIIRSFVDDIIMPVISLVTGGIDFSSWLIVLGENPDGLKTYAELTEAGIATLAYGNFISSIIYFLIMAFMVFLLVKAVAKIRALMVKKEEAAPTTKKCPFCCTDIDIKATRCPHCTSEIPAEE